MRDEGAATNFLAYAQDVLKEHYLPKIKEAVMLLSDAEIWAREGDVSNSIGNLLLHLSGNIRQHIIAGAGGLSDVRNRPLEFAARGGIPKEKLLHQLEQTVNDAVDVLKNLKPETLGERRTVQDKDVLLIDDIFHVIEHFAYHTGQIIYVAKAVKQHDFGWYKYLDPK
ncbi:MAG: DinB family protein [Calditrichota bacterium]